MEIARLKLDIDTEEIMRSLFDCSEYWQSRSTEYPFYTLGKSAYLDGKTDAYYEDSAWLNDILLGHFYGLYESVIHVLQEELDEPIELAHDLALPGFHIFPTNIKFLSIAGNSSRLPAYNFRVGRRRPPCLHCCNKASKIWRRHGLHG
jgi:hypothetical protein